jgi:hypothetical protein
MMFDAIPPYSRHAGRSLTLVVFLMVMALTTSAALAAAPNDTQQLEEPSATNQPETPDNIPELFGAAYAAQHAQYEKAIALMERHLTVTKDGLFALDKQGLAAEQEYNALAADVVRSLEESLQQTNDMILSGQSSATDFATVATGGGADGGWITVGQMILSTP